MPLILLSTITCGVTYLVIRDAQARAMNGKGWGFFMVFTMMAGLPVYLLARRGHPKA